MSSNKITLERRIDTVLDRGIVTRIEWSRSLPFAMSSNLSARLVHRVRHGATILHNGKRHHDAVSYWCGNGVCRPLLFGEVPAGRMICSRCEAMAVAAGLGSTDAIVGRHVHRGRLVVEQTCCRDQEAANSV